jgi:hypothetical protein
MQACRDLHSQTLQARELPYHQRHHQQKREARQDQYRSPRSHSEKNDAFLRYAQVIASQSPKYFVTFCHESKTWSDKGFLEVAVEQPMELAHAHFSAHAGLPPADGGRFSEPWSRLGR